MKTLIAYYSNNGSNKYLAAKFAQALECEIEAIRPRLNMFVFQLIFSWIKASPGIGRLKHTVADYDRIILCGPIWMGQFVSPLRTFVNKYKKQINSLYFATCCGSYDAIKDDTFGYATVFLKIKELLGDKCALCEAFPIGLVVAENKLEDSDTIMKTRLSDDNFTGEIQQRFNSFVHKIAEQHISESTK